MNTHTLFYVCPCGTASHSLQKKGDTSENGELFVLAEKKKKTGPVFPVRLTVILPPAVRSYYYESDLSPPGCGEHGTN